MGGAPITCLRATGHPVERMFPGTNLGSDQFGNGIVRGNVLFDIVNIGRDAQAAACRFIPSSVSNAHPANILFSYA